jgi:hypothetical protein
MFVARQIPLLAIFLLVALSGPELAAAESPAPGAVVAAATESVASEASTVTTTATSVEVAPPPAETTPPPPTPTKAEAATPPSLPAESTDSGAPPSSPSPQLPKTVEHVAAVVDSAARSSLPPEPQQLAGVTQEAQEELGDAVDRAAGKGEEVLRAATTDAARKSSDRPVDASRPVRDVVSTVLGSTKTVLGSAKDILLPFGSIEPTLSMSPPSIPSSSLAHPPTAPSETAAAMPTLPFPAPAATPFQAPPTYRAPTLPLVSVPTPLGDESDSGPAVLTDPTSSLHWLSGPIGSPPASDGPSSAGASSPAIPSLPSPSLPNALGAVTTAPGGTGSGLLFALLALSLLLVPTFASKLRMRVGDCRPAPFVSLLERPG